MLDGFTLDQLRFFVAAVEEGSFSAAARRMHRVQSAVSETVANLESQLGVLLFDRSGRSPRLTIEGRTLLADARTIVNGIDTLKARAKGMIEGLEPELTVVVDVFFPLRTFAEVAQEFGKSFPDTPLRLFVEALGATVEPVIDGRASFGLVASLPSLPPGLSAEPVASVNLVMVAAKTHPLAAYRGTVPQRALAEHVQLILTDRSDLSVGIENGVMSPVTWRLGDLFAKHAFLLSGLGWGGMPLHVVEDDVAAGRLVVLAVEVIPPGGHRLPISAVHRSACAPGPAGRWMIDRLRRSCSGALESTQPETA